MYVCICKAVTEREIQACIRDGATSLACLQDRLGVGTSCGRCKCEVQRVVDEHCDFCPEPCSAALDGLPAARADSAVRPSLAASPC